MKAWSRRYTLIAGLTLIASSNAVALLGVAWNRSSGPECELRLSQRELNSPYRYRSERDENSGLAFRLVPRILTPATEAYDWNHNGLYGSPEWLNQEKLESLGFDIAAMVQQTTEPRGRIRKQPSQAVMLVLELAGPAYGKSLERAQRHLANQQEKLAAKPDDKEFGQRVKNAQERLKQEESANSRLFIVDAGLDLAALRARYPDRAKYAIVKGQVRASVSGSARETKVSGTITELGIDEIHVPHAYRNQLTDSPATRSGQSPRFEAAVAFGKRLEPWITGLTRN